MRGFLDKNGATPANQVYTVHQGVAMGSPSAIQLRARGDGAGCWLSGVTQWMT